MRSRGSLTYDEALKLACEAKEINGSEYACPFAGCARKFARRVGIASHLRVHTGMAGRAVCARGVCGYVLSNPARSLPFEPLKQGVRRVKLPTVGCRPPF
jgi:hypothetical protein